jgi:hypothetical protein
LRCCNIEIEGLRLAVSVSCQQRIDQIVERRQLGANPISRPLMVM